MPFHNESEDRESAGDTIWDYFAHAPRVERRDNLSYEDFYAHYISQSKPVIVTDVTKNWQAMSKWTQAFFRDHYGGLSVGNRDWDKTKKVTMKTCIDAMKASTAEKPGPYLTSLKIKELFPELEKDIEPKPSYWDPNWLDDPKILIGFPYHHDLVRTSALEINIGGNYTAFPEGIHCDDFQIQTFVTQIVGEKDWLFFPPEQAKYLYRKPHPFIRTNTNSKIPVTEKLNLNEFPLLKKTQPVRA